MHKPYEISDIRRTYMFITANPKCTREEIKAALNITDLQLSRDVGRLKARGAVRAFGARGNRYVQSTLTYVVTGNPVRFSNFESVGKAKVKLTPAESQARLARLAAKHKVKADQAFKQLDKLIAKHGNLV